MAGHVRQRRPGVWELRVYVGRDPLTGRPQWTTRTVKAAGKKAAQLAADELALSIVGTAVDAQTVTLGEHLERWWRFGVDQSLWSPGVEKLHREYIDGRFKPLHDKRVAMLRTVDLDKFYAALRARGGREGKPLATATVVRVASVLSLALDQAVRWDLIKTNPADNAQPGRVKRKKVARPDDGPVLALLAAARKRDPELVCYLFLDAESGARRAELAALRLTDFTGDGVSIARALTIGLASDENARRYAGHYWPSKVRRGGRLTALIEKDPKTEESIRDLALAPPTILLVAEQIARLRKRSAKAGRAYPDDGFLFPHPTSNGTRPLRADTWTHRFARLRDAAGVTGVRLHDLRHYVITTLLAGGLDLASVAGRAGHGGGGKTTLAIYGHPTKSVDRRASDIMAAILHPEPDEASESNVVPIRPAAGA